MWLVGACVGIVLFTSPCVTVTFEEESRHLRIVALPTVNGSGSECEGKGGDGRSRARRRGVGTLREHLGNT